MKKLLLLLLFMSPLFSKGQTNVYHPFPDSNAVWRVSYGGYQAPYCYDRYYFLGEAILMNGRQYHVVYYSQCDGIPDLETGMCNASCTADPSIWYDYFGFIAQDTLQKKVYFIGISDTTEYLLYDFSLNVGDTIPPSINNFYQATIQSIDSILINGSYRKRFNVNAFCSIIEGIGSTTGLIEELFVFEFGGHLNCFSQNGETLYPDTTSICDLTTLVESISKKRVTLKISPNPAHNSFTITSPFQNAELEIYNMLGVEVYSKTLNTKPQTLNPNLSAGIYFVKVSDGEQVIVEKLVIE
jgi:hypothetical protein